MSDTNPSRMEFDGVRRNEPMRMEGELEGRTQRSRRILLNADNFLDSVLEDFNTIRELSAEEIVKIFKDGRYNAYINFKRGQKTDQLILNRLTFLLMENPENVNN